MEYTVAELAGITGAKPRSIQFWAASGLLHPNPDTMGAGPGTHRRYSREEALVACVLHALTGSIRLALGDLRNVAEGARNLMEHRDARADVEAVIAGNRRMYLIFERWGGKHWSLHMVGADPADAATPSLELAKAMARSAQHLEKDNSAAMIVLLNKYTKGLR